MSFKQFKKKYQAFIQHNTTTHELSEFEIKQYAWAISMASKPLFAVCLPQALALKYFLRNDDSSKIIIGVSTQYALHSSTFLAHAWVEKNNEILIGNFLGTNFKPLWIWS